MRVGVTVSMVVERRSRRQKELLSFCLREECVDGVCFLVSTAPMVHDAVAHPGRLLVSPRGQLMLDGEVGQRAGRFIVVLDEGTTFTEGCPVSRHGSVVHVGQSFFFDRAGSAFWAGDEVLSLLDDHDAVGVIGIGT